MNDYLDIEFNPELFNDLFWELQRDFDDEKIRFIYAYGGSSASKTYTVVQLLVIRMLTQKDDNTMVMRKYGVDIKDSIYSDFTGIIEGWELKEHFICQTNYIKCKLTGTYIRFRGLDDSEKIKGLANFKRVILEEISQFDEADLKQTRKRLRGRKNQQIIGLFNPIEETHWLKCNIFDKAGLIPKPITCNITEKRANEAGDFVVYKVTYLNNYYIVGKFNEAGEQIGGFVDMHTINDFEKDRLNDFAYYQIYGLGNWGKIRTGGEFWKDFNANTNIVKAKWNESLPLHISLDENVNPYLTCLVFQIDGKNITQIDEICLPDPLNRRHYIANEFKRRYPCKRCAGLFIYGDRTSWKEDTGKEKGENFFTDYVGHLKEYNPSLRLQSVNPSIFQSGAFVNKCFAGHIEGLTLTIADTCLKSIHDYTYALEDSDGTLKKSKKTNPVTKVSYEEFGHASDCLRYIVTVAFAHEYEEHLSGGKSINFKAVTIKRKNQF
jgi:PBSX family phage terminase large subunit